MANANLNTRQNMLEAAAAITQLTSLLRGSQNQPWFDGLHWISICISIDRLSTYLESEIRSYPTSSSDQEPRS